MDTTKSTAETAPTASEYRAKHQHLLARMAALDGWSKAEVETGTNTWDEPWLTAEFTHESGATMDVKAIAVEEASHYVLTPADGDGELKRGRFFFGGDALVAAADVMEAYSLGASGR